MATSIKLTRASGARDGYGATDLLLERDLEPPIVVDAAELGPCHPMFAVRLRMFVDWHRAAAHDVRVVPPADATVAGYLAAMAVLPDDLGAPVGAARGDALLPLRRLHTHHDVEDAAAEATEVLEHQAIDLAVWGDAMHMALGELCDNALQHGAVRNELGAYVAADRVDHPQRLFRLAIADLGIGIPEHIRAHHPEWHDDGAAIARALERGVSGTGDPHRGNGFAEVFDKAVEDQLVRSMSAATLDIRSGKGRVAVELVAGHKKVTAPPVDAPRRGTWITYTVASV
jgi:hypothetical protein